MQRKKFLIFIGTIAIFFLLIIIAVVVLVTMPKEPEEEDIDLASYYEDKKADILNSVKDIKFVSVEDYIKEGKDPVASINSALFSERYVLFPRNFNHVLKGKIVIKDDTIIKFEEGSRIVGARPDIESPMEHCLFFLYGVKNVTIIGNGATIVTTETGIAKGYPTICMYGSKDVSIMDLSLESPTGYGVVVSRYMRTNGPNFASERIDIMNVAVKDARQGGLLVRSAQTLRVYELSVQGSKGIVPESGVTIDPDLYEDKLVEIQMQKISTSHNHGIGLMIMPGFELDENCHIFIKDYSSDHDGGFAPIYFMDSVDGKVTLRNLVLLHEEGLAALFRTWDTRSCEVDIYKPVTNSAKGFPYMIADQHGDPFPTNLEKLIIKK